MDADHATSGHALPDLFADTVARHGSRPAIEFDGATLTYRELADAAARWAGWLNGRGIGAGDRVAIHLPRGIEVHAVLLGVLEAGAAYVPVDPDCPAERVAFIVADSGARCLITSATLEHPPGDHVVRVEEAREAVAREVPSAAVRRPRRPLPDDEAYVIYTSGSTGRPKGVSISHRSVSHLVRVEGDLFGVRPDDRVFHGFSLAFDASVEELWLAYHSGATLVVGSQEAIRSGPDLARHMAGAGITVLSCVPTLLMMMGIDVDTVRLLIVGGEACPDDLVRRWARGGRRMFNTYGPTEATVIATCGECVADRPVTIGRPLPGYRARIVDEQLRDVPAGEAGELLLGGIGLSRGYVGLPDLTAERFVEAARAEADEPGGRWYRTGDLCRRDANGDIEFLGRIDGQVKIRGYRVELGEIEAVLLDDPAVRAAAVAVREDRPGLRHVVAYVVPHAGPDIDERALLEAARRRLPPYMVPALVETVDALPMLPSGKIDRSRLPAPRPRAAADEPGDAAGATPAEAVLLAEWRRLFAPLAVSIDSDFFVDLGGDSLAAAGMISALRTQPEFRDASMVDIYRHPTIRGFARACARDAASSGAAPGSAAGGTTPRRPARPPSSARFVAYGAAQALGLYVILGVAGTQWLAPFLAYSWLDDDGCPVVVSLLGGVGVLVGLYPVLVLLVVAMKWLLLGRVRAGSHPLWGWFAWRWWFVRTLESVIPINYLVGTPLLPAYARLMGARIGRAVHLGTEALGAYDLLTIGDGTAIGGDTVIPGCSVRGGRLHLGPVTIGRECFVGSRALLREHVTMEDGGRLEDLSMLPVGGVVREGETWAGSPAVRVGTGRTVGGDFDSRHGTRVRRFWFGVAQACGVSCVPVLVVAALLPGMAAIHHLNQADDYYWYLFLSPVIGLGFVTLLALEIVAAKWLVLGRVRAGSYPLYGGFSLRKWFIDQLLDLSVDVLGPMYSTLYLPPWYRALGAKLGRLAEVSTASFVSPDLLSLEDGSFVADVVSLGAARVEAGRITVDRIHVGRRSFVGNSAVLPPGTVLGDDCLVGCLSAPPRPAAGADRVADGSSWVGSPALSLPHRAVNRDFPAERTYAPPRRLVALRLAIEFFRVVLPSAGFLSVAGLMFSLVSILRDEIETWQLCLAFPLLYAAACGIFVGVAIVLKWLLVGRYRPCERPLWSGFVWRTELVTALHDFFVAPLLLESLRGTPFLAWYFRLMGASIGRRVYLDTVQISEFDLVTIGDDACLDADATLQTHLFEDRVMKMSHVEVGAGCAVGAESLVLYDSRMEAGATLGGLSLLMKGEVLPAGTGWEGTPARAAARAAFAPGVGVAIVGHGTADATGAAETAEVAALAAALLPGVPVELGFLEVIEPSIAAAVDRLAARGCREVVAAPLLLFRAGHARRDVPEALAAAAAAAGVVARQAEPLGLHEALVALSAARRREAVERLVPVPPDETVFVMLGRGASDPGAIDRLREFAAASLAAEGGRRPARIELGFAAAARPTLDEALAAAAAAQPRRVVVQPHLLFRGHVEDQVAAAVARARSAWPRIEWVEVGRLGADPLVARAVADRAREAAADAADGGDVAD